MASVKWRVMALDQLVRYDIWRVRHGWEPIASEIMEAVRLYFDRQDPEAVPHHVPGRRVRLRGEPRDLRMVTIRVRGKLFRVYFRYKPAVFEIRRVYHPSAEP